jgi:single-strand DNA-binding protein
MAGYNRVIMVGNLTRDPDYKQLPSGQAVCTLGIASNRQYKSKQTGAMVQEVCFIDADVFGPQADSCKQFLQKGRPVLIEGRLKFDSWETPEGQKRNKYSIVADRVIFLGSSAGAGEIAVEPASIAAPEAPKKRTAKPQTKAADIDIDNADAVPAGELSFKDEPPFVDDLPF